MSFTGFSPPTKKIVLQHNDFSAEIWPELGGAVANFYYGAANASPRSIFRPARQQDHYMPTDLACWPLVPYSNRIAQGLLRWEGQEFQLARNVSGHPHALHGFGWQRPWQVLAQDQSSCRLMLEHVPDSDWPFACRAEQLFTLTADGLEISSTLVNSGRQMMPYGLGQHPYIARPPGTRLFADVKGVWHTDATVMPTTYGDLPEAWNLRAGCKLDGVFMDNGFDGLRGAATVLWADGARLAITGSAQLTHLVVYNPPQEDYVCVEPVSHMTDAFNRTASGAIGTGCATLQPGACAVGVHRFVYHAAPV